MSFQYIQYSVQKEGVLCLRSIHRGVIKSFDVESMGNVGTQLSDNATLNNMPLSMLYIPVLHIGCPFHPLSHVLVSQSPVALLHPAPSLQCPHVSLQVPDIHAEM